MPKSEILCLGVRFGFFGSMEVDEISHGGGFRRCRTQQTLTNAYEESTLWNLVKRFEISLIERPRPLVEVCCKL